MGAGPAGLAAAGEAHRSGLTAQVLDAAEAVGASWRGHYDRLRLHTTRGLSALPRVPIPERLGRWVARDDFIAYLEHYARKIGVPIRLGVRVERINRIDAAGGGWRLVTSAGELEAGQVVIATGHNHTPRIPDWPGKAAFTGELIHSSAYRNPAPFRGRDVLVVGAGNSGPAGIAPQYLGILMRPLPLKIVDPLSLLVQRLVVGDLSRYGIAAPATGVATRVLDGHIPLIDVGFLAELKAGRIEVVPDITRFDGSEVVCGERRLQADAVIAATGYSPGLEPMVGHLGVLDANGHPNYHAPQSSHQASGLFFIGYSNPISGNLREIAHDARALGPVLAMGAGVRSQLSRVEP